MQHRTQLITPHDLEPLVDRDKTMICRYFAAGHDGGLAMVGPNGRYLVHPNDVAEVVARLRTVPGRQNRPKGTRPPVA